MESATEKKTTFNRFSASLEQSVGGKGEKVR